MGLLELLNNVRTYILEFLDLRSITRLSRTCKKLHRFVLSLQNQICRRFLSQDFPKMRLGRVAGKIWTFGDLHKCYRVLHNDIEETRYLSTDGTSNILYDMSGELLVSDERRSLIASEYMILDVVRKIPGYNVVIGFKPITRSLRTFIKRVKLFMDNVETIRLNPQRITLYRLENGSTVAFANYDHLRDVPRIYRVHRIEGRIDLLVLDQRDYSDLHEEPVLYNMYELCSSIDEIVTKYLPDVYAVGLDTSMLFENILYNIVFRKHSKLIRYTDKHQVGGLLHKNVLAYTLVNCGFRDALDSKVQKSNTKSVMFFKVTYNSYEDIFVHEIQAKEAAYANYSNSVMPYSNRSVFTWNCCTFLFPKNTTMLLSEVPKDIALDIITLLDLQSIINLRSTCRTIRKLIMGLEEKICHRLFSIKFPRAVAERAAGGMKKFINLTECYRLAKKGSMYDTLPLYYAGINIVYESSGKLLHLNNGISIKDTVYQLYQRLIAIPGTNMVIVKATDYIITNTCSFNLESLRGLFSGDVKYGKDKYESGSLGIYMLSNGSTVVTCDYLRLAELSDDFESNGIKDRIDILVMDREGEMGNINEQYGNEPERVEALTNILNKHKPDIFAVGDSTVRSERRQIIGARIRDSSIKSPDVKDSISDFGIYWTAALTGRHIIRYLSKLSNREDEGCNDVTLTLNGKVFSLKRWVMIDRIRSKLCAG